MRLVGEETAWGWCRVWCQARCCSKQCMHLGTEHRLQLFPACRHGTAMRLHAAIGSTVSLNWLLLLCSDVGKSRGMQSAQYVCETASWKAPGITYSNSAHFHIAAAALITTRVSDLPIAFASTLVAPA